MILALLLAAQEVPAPMNLAHPPVPIHPGEWATYNDYPPQSLARGEYGTVRFTLTIDTTGKADGCYVTWTSGFAALDQYSCAIFLRRARFKPAQDASGKAIRGLYSNRFSWIIPGEEKKVDVPALGLTVSLEKLPNTYQRPAILRVHFARSGTPDACRVEVPTGNAALDKIACEQTMARATAPAVQPNGGPRPDTRMMEVAFEAGAK